MDAFAVRQFPAFPPLGKPAGASLPSVCIVTNELVGLFKNGGIGTSMTGLAQCLARAGFPVTVLYSASHRMAPDDRRKWTAEYGAIGIRLEWLDPNVEARLAGPVVDIGFTAPMRVWLHLRDRPFDIIQFNDCLGDGYLCLAMARLGLAFRNTHLLVGLHSPSQWIFEINRTSPGWRATSAYNFAERFSVAHADLLWSPSHYLLDWAVSAGFEIADAHYVQQYALPARPTETTAQPSAQQPDRIREIVFFGRLEERKGLRLFCAALGQIDGFLQQNAIKVTFLGKIANIGGQPADSFLKDQSRAWGFAWQIKADLGQREAIAHLKSGQTLAVMASPADNSPCTVYEALDEGLCFIAARTGGIPELIDAQDRDRVLFDYDADALASKLIQSLTQGCAPARAANSQDACRARWVDAYAALPDLVGSWAAVATGEHPWLALVDHYQGDDLAATMASLEALDQVRGVIILNHGPSPLASDEGRVAAKTVNLVDQGCQQLPGLLNLADDERVLMLRSGCAVRPDGFAMAAAALQAEGVDGVLPAGLTAEGKLLVPLGGSPSFAFWHGVDLGGGMALKADRLKPLLDAQWLAPNSPYCNIADIAVSQGLKLWPLPEPLLSHAGKQSFAAKPLPVPERVLRYSAVSDIERYYIQAQSLAMSSRKSGLSRSALVRAIYHRLASGRAARPTIWLRSKIPAGLLRRIIGS